MAVRRQALGIALVVLGASLVQRLANGAAHAEVGARHAHALAERDGRDLEPVLAQAAVLVAEAALEVEESLEALAPTP